MKIAKLIRHRHRFDYYLNDTLRGVEEDVHFKILFSDLEEKKKFDEWLKEFNGYYKWDKEENKVTEDSKLPALEGYDPNELCWCEVAQFFLLNIADYELQFISSPYKMEVYVNNNGNIIT